MTNVSRCSVERLFQKKETTLNQFSRSFEPLNVYNTKMFPEILNSAHTDIDLSRQSNILGNSKISLRERLDYPRNILFRNIFLKLCV